MVDFFEGIYMMNNYKLRYNFPVVADGSSRTVYDIGRGLVIKRATNNEGVGQCRVENHVYSHTGEYLRGYLCPVLWHAPGAVVMIKASPVIHLIWLLGTLQ
jgi:hypothetical protein